MYTKTHIYFLQHMLKVGCLTTEKAKEIIYKINSFVDDKGDDDENTTQFSLKQFTNEINSRIGEQGLKLAIIPCEVTSKDNIVIIQISNEDINNMKFSYTEAEVEYFHVLLKEIIESDEKNLDHIMSLNLASTISVPFSRFLAEAFLKILCCNGYLVANDGTIYLGPRTILEYTTYFHNECKDYITICKLCSELVFTGSNCSNCSKVLHNHCLEKFLRKQKHCPLCKKTWGSQNDESRVSTIHDDSTEIESSNEDEEPSTPVISKQSKKKRKR